MNKKKTTEQFVEEAKIIHGDKYNYSKVNYTSNKDKIVIICKIHGEFEHDLRLMDFVKKPTLFMNFMVIIGMEIQIYMNQMMKHILAKHLENYLKKH